MEKMVSIIIPAYEAEKYIERCVSSIQAQTCKNLEIIIIDDGSTDDTGVLCDIMKQKDNRITVIHMENGGAVRARKAGMEASCGEWIYFADADDYLEADTIEKMLKTAIDNSCDIVCAGVIKETGLESRKLFNMIKSGCYDKSTLETVVYPYMLYSGKYYTFGIQQYLWNKLFRREIIEKWIMYVPDRVTCGDDVLSLYPALLEAERVCVLEEAYYHYCLHEDSMTGSQNKDFVSNAVMIYECLHSVFEKSEYRKIMLPQLETYIIYLLDIAKNRLGLKKEPSDEEIVIPYAKIPTGSRIILYGAGKYGQAYFKEISGNNHCEIVLWVDKNWENLRRQGMFISPLEQIFDGAYDKIVIALKDEEIKANIKKYLTDKNIPEDKIL